MYISKIKYDGQIDHYDIFDDITINIFSDLSNATNYFERIYPEILDYFNNEIRNEINEDNLNDFDGNFKSYISDDKTSFLISDNYGCNFVHGEIEKKIVNEFSDLETVLKL